MSPSFILPFSAAACRSFNVAGLKNAAEMGRIGGMKVAITRRIIYRARPNNTITVHRSPNLILPPISHLGSYESGKQSAYGPRRPAAQAAGAIRQPQNRQTKPVQILHAHSFKEIYRRLSDARKLISI